VRVAIVSYFSSACAGLLSIALAAACGCAGIQVEFADQAIDFGAPLGSSAATPVGLVLFDDDTPRPGEIGSMTSYLPPPVNTYRLAWVWGTLEFYCDEPLAREFTNAMGEGLERVGCQVFRSPAPEQWDREGVRLLAQRTGARRVVHGAVREFHIESKWTLADPCKMSIVIDVRVFDESGGMLSATTIREQSTRRLVAGELGAVTAKKQAAEAFRRCIEKVFGDPAFRETLKVAS